MKKIAALLTILCLSVILNGCYISRAHAIKNLKVMPMVNTEGMRKECVARANTGQCQIWVVYEYLTPIEDIEERE